MAKLCLGLLVFLTSLLWAATDPVWDNGIALLENGKAADAVSALEAWQTAEPSRTRSPELHHNLAIAHSRLSEWSPAVFHLLQSASLRSRPFYSLEALANVSRVQHRLLIQNSVSDHWAFRFGLLVPPSFLYGVLLLGIWILLFSIFLPRFRKKAGIACFGFFFVALTGLSVRATLPIYGVVLPAQTAVKLYADPALSAEREIVDLPAGTLVSLSARQGSSIQVFAPFAGWVSNSALRPISQ